MPHLTVHVLEEDLVGRESELISALTYAVIDVYGERLREDAVVQLIGLPRGRWGIGGRSVEAASPAVTFGIREEAFARPDASQRIARLVAGVTDAVTSVFGEQVRAGVRVELVGNPAGRTAVGGILP
jgi:phenylpyruvate tautomerase PptA (4-oxalocrotonate tautomerase family)